MSDFAAIRFLAGRPLTKELGADRLNTILTEIKRNKPKGERGITVRQDGTGTYIGLSAALTKGGGSTSLPLPWDIYVKESEGDGENKTYTLKVTPGTLARILPSNYDDEFPANNTSLYYGIARVSTDGTYITDVNIDISASAPTPQTATEWALPTSVDILFGLFAQGGSHNLVTTGNIDAYGKNVIITTDEDAAIGDPVYKLWFKLQ
jgi:hypothetical protein